MYYTFNVHKFVNFVSKHSQSQSRYFGTKRVTQKRRFLLRILRPEEKSTEKTMTDGLFDRNDCLPKSLLKSPVIRKLIYSNTEESIKLASQINWDAYKSDVRGVRWHPSGSWMVQFVKRNYENNFFVNCSTYFSVEKYGFFEAKRLAIAYRRRLELEYSELEKTWKDLENFRDRQARRIEASKLDQIKGLEDQFLLSDKTHSVEA